MGRKKLTMPPKGAFCTHKRMRYQSCGNCPRPCMVTCPDCGLTWMLYEGALG